MKGYLGIALIFLAAVSVIIYFIAVSHIDEYARGKVEEAIRSKDAIRELHTDLKKMALKDVSNEINKIKESGEYPFITDKGWEFRECRAKAAVGNFIDNEIKRNTISIDIISYPEKGSGSCIKCYKFTLRWNKESFATFRLNDNREPVQIKKKQNSKFITTLKDKGMKAAKTLMPYWWPLAKCF